MIDFNNERININCPECKRTISVTLKQVADEVTVKCKCGQAVKLKDDDKGSAKRSISNLNQSMKELKDTLKNFGR